MTIAAPNVDLFDAQDRLRHIHRRELSEIKELKPPIQSLLIIRSSFARSSTVYEAVLAGPSKLAFDPESISVIFVLHHRSGDRNNTQKRQESAMPLTRKLAAEFIGTFWLVFGGCGSAVLAAAFPHVGIGLLGRRLGLRSDCRGHGLCDRRRVRLSSESGRNFRPGPGRTASGQGNAALLDRAGFGGIVAAWDVGVHCRRQRLGPAGGRTRSERLRRSLARVITAWRQGLCAKSS